MYTILHLTDTHLTTSTPEHPSPRRFRLGTYEDDIFTKLDAVVKLANEEQVDIICHTGDVFDRPTESYGTVVRLIRDIIDASEVPWIFACGQHDMVGYNPGTVWEKSLGAVLAATRTRTATGSEVLNVKIQGDDRPQQNFLCLDESVTLAHLLTDEYTPKIDAPFITLIHANIGFDERFMIHPDNVKLGELAQIALCGDIHSGFKPYRNKEGTLFVNPGALARLNADEMHRKPQVAIIRGVDDVEYREIPHKPADTVFDLGAIGAQEDRDARESKFKEAVQEVSGQTFGDWRQDLSAEEGNYLPKVLTLMRQYCEKAEAR